MPAPPICITSLDGPDITVRILDAVAPPTAHAARIAAAWESLRVANPRYHDGPILVVTSTDPFTVRRDTYRTLATAATIDPTIRSLGVQAVVIGRDESQAGHVLFGRRCIATRIYGGLWENAPSGSVPAPPNQEHSIETADLIKTIRDEGIEELGLDLDRAQTCPIALLEDEQASSLDIVFEIRLLHPIDPRRTSCPIHSAGRWEYADAAWVNIDDIRPWSRRRGQVLTPPTLALVESLGWL